MPHIVLSLDGVFETAFQRASNFLQPHTPPEDVDVFETWVYAAKIRIPMPIKVAQTTHGSLDFG